MHRRSPFKSQCPLSFSLKKYSSGQRVPEEGGREREREREKLEGDNCIYK